MSTTVVDEAAFRSRLTQVIHAYGAVAALAAAVGVSDNAIYKWLSGRGTERGEPGGAGASGAGDGGVAGDGGRGVAEFAGGRAREHGDFIFMPRNRIRFWGGRDGTLSSEQVVDSIAFRAAWVKQTLNAEPRDLILIEAAGDLMAPTVKDSDLILANLAEPRFRQDGIYLLRHDGGLTVKRVQRRPDGKVLVRSDNPKYEAMVVSNVKIIGRVIWIGGRV